MKRDPSKIRRHLAVEAARLMYDEAVGQYFVAKRMAAKRLFGRGGQKRLRFRPRDLPSNGEIQAALLQLAELREGDHRLDRLHDMRRVALEVMERLAPFEPRLIGSVATGHIRAGSDIDIQLFADDRDAPEDLLRAEGVPYERELVLIRRPTGFVEYLHLRLDLDYPVELTVYDRRELRHRPRSSTDGLPIERVPIREVARWVAAPPGS
ncbi:MAG: nucleotidyltransferase [Sandaracinaceae bacterium]|nr:nucleotidyltransferase [Sandaracinaceae bacterium]